MIIMLLAKSGHQFFDVLVSANQQGLKPVLSDWRVVASHELHSLFEPPRHNAKASARPANLYQELRPAVTCRKYLRGAASRSGMVDWPLGLHGAQG